MRRVAPWQLEKQRTAKGLRELAPCDTPGCDGKAMGALFGIGLCPRCQQQAQRAQRERT